MTKRIMIVGQPGSGKSTLAQVLSKRTGLPVFHIDKIHWKPGWLGRTKAEKTLLCQEVEARESWIFEGGHSATWPSRLARADMLVWLDRPVGLRMWRVLRRAVIGWGQTRPDMADGCPEQLSSLPEFLHYIWSTRNSQRGKIAELTAAAPKTCRIFHLRLDQDVEHFISDVIVSKLLATPSTAAGFSWSSAREAECDEDEARWTEGLKKVASQTPSKAKND